ncbi:HD-GYP domain-containing protein [Thermotoga profunda]|uniref:HD-GYP domain-containing protein n=1 Tax=Thermotoga profunda TaxID=1508420 RepID=UPI00059766B6|nr:HD-GYP domain-containing protein [Thermotoga profunda]
MKLTIAARSLVRYGFLLILTLICVFIVGFVIIFQNVHRYYSQTYLKSERQLLESIIDNVLKGKQQADVIIRTLSHDLIDLQTEADLSRALSYKKLPWLVSDFRGLFASGNSAKILIENQNSLLLIEIPQSFFKNFLTSELADVLLVTDQGEVILSTQTEIVGTNAGNKNKFVKLNNTLGYLYLEDLPVENAKAGVFIPIQSYFVVLLPYLIISSAALIGTIVWMIFFLRFENKLVGATAMVVNNISKSTTQIEKNRDVNYIPVKTNIDELNELQESIVKLLDIEKASQVEMHAMMNSLQDTVNELEEMQRILQERNTQIISTLAEAIEIKDTSTFGHSGRVVNLALDLAKELGITDPADLEAIKFGALLHDVGKIGIPEHILNKPGRLTFEEFEIMKKHPLYGEKIIKNISGWDLVADIVRHHHENIDGSGYPDGLAGDQISIRAQIVSIVDVFTALIEERPYRPALSLDEALKIIENEMIGVKFHPDLYKAFLKVVKRRLSEFGL